MRIEMYYLNKNNQMEKVDVLGYAEGGLGRDYCECWTEEKGHFIVPIQNLFAIGNEDPDDSVRYIGIYEDSNCLKDNTSTGD